MKVVVVYESLWGNTAAIARAIAEGFGPDARALSTGEATAAAISGADLIVAGAPVLGFRLPTEKMRQSIRSNPGFGALPPDLSNPSAGHDTADRDTVAGRRLAAWRLLLREPQPAGSRLHSDCGRLLWRGT